MCDVLNARAPAAQAAALTLFARGGAPYPELPTTLRSALALYVGRVGVVYGGVAAAAAAKGLDLEPARWTLSFLVFGGRPRSRRLGLAAFWAVSLVVALRAITRGATRFARIERRKLFHALACWLFLPACRVDAQCLSLAYGAATCLLLLVEDLRLARAPPLEAAVSTFYDAFLDDRDGVATTPRAVTTRRKSVAFSLFKVLQETRSPAALTHVYLLLGCALPHWAADALEGDGAPCRALRVGGVVVLGVGDAAAAVVGRRFGTTRWPGTRRTLQGSVAFASAAGLAFALDAQVLAPATAPKLPPSLFTTVIPAVALLEALAAHVDNLVLPLYYATLVLAAVANERALLRPFPPV